MIGLLIASAINLTGCRRRSAAPTDAFRGCLKEAAVKAKTEKVTGDGDRRLCAERLQRPDEYARRKRVIAFRVKNGMSRKDAAGDAEHDGRRLCRDARPTITSSWPISTSPRRHRLLLLTRRLRRRRRLWRLTNRQSPRLLDSRDLAENMIEQKAAARRERNPRDFADQVTRADEPFNSSPVDD